MLVENGNKFSIFKSKLRGWSVGWFDAYKKTRCGYKWTQQQQHISSPELVHGWYADNV